MIAGNAGLSLDIPPFAMTDRAGRILGLNRVGMRRAGITKEEVVDVRDAYRVLLGPSGTSPESLQAISGMARSARI